MRLILLPGLDGTGRLFSPLLQVLPPHIQATVITYPPDERRSYSELCERVAALLPPNEPFVIVAESFSGPIAIRLAAASYPNLRAVVLCASFVYVPGSSVFRAVFTCLSRCMFAVAAPRWAVRYFLAGSDVSEELLASFYATVSTVSPSVLSHRLRIALAADERPTLRATTVPLLYLLPTRDHLLGRGSVDLMLHFRRDIVIAPIEAPHFVLQRKPTEAIQRIDTWVNNLGLTGRCG